MIEEIDKVKELADMVARRLGYEIFDVRSHKRGRKMILTITIDNMKEYGSIEDCENFSRELSPLLDAETTLGNYILEVSSPGLDRPLKDLKDFQRFEGRLAKVRLKDEEGKKGRTIVGRIAGCDIEKQTFSLEIDGNVEEYEFSRVKMANLEIEF